MKKLLLAVASMAAVLGFTSCEGDRHHDRKAPPTNETQPTKTTPPAEQKNVNPSH